MAEQNFLTRAHTSFSGADIKAVFANKEVGNLMAVSYAIQREKAPIYVLGEANPRAFSRGKRGIAGSLIFIQFDTHAILEQFQDSAEPNLGKFVKKVYEQDASSFADPVAPGTLTGDSNSMGVLASAFYADQIPPFDITVTALNEVGVAAKCAIHGVELMNEGWGMGIEDRQADMQTTYLARAVTRWTREANPKFSISKNSAGSVVVSEVSGG